MAAGKTGSLHEWGKRTVRETGNSVRNTWQREAERHWLGAMQHLAGEEEVA